jgi:glycosyltransferase involved in cell wall biosynthesis
MDEGTRTRIRESLGVAEEQFVYLLLGWEPDRKGVDRFVQAAVKTTRAAEAPALFLIVGERATRDFVARLPESLSLGDRLRVIDPVEDFPALLSAIDVMVSSSRREAFGYAVVESMAAGKMVLSSDIPGARKTYGESQGVWLFPVEDASAQAAAMARVRALPAAERDALGGANARYVADRYSVTAWAQRVGDVYQDLLTPRSRWR